jgi:hypothetical protein
MPVTEVRSPLDEKPIEDVEPAMGVLDERETGTAGAFQGRVLVERRVHRYSAFEVNEAIRSGPRGSSSKVYQLGTRIRFLRVDRMDSTPPLFRAPSPFPLMATVIGLARGRDR